MFSRKTAGSRSGTMAKMPKLTTKILEGLDQAGLDELTGRLIVFVREESQRATLEETKELFDTWGFTLLNYTINKGLDKCQFSRLLPVSIFSSVYTAGSRHRERLNELATHHRDGTREYLTSCVVPALDSKHDDALLEEFRRRWEDHKLYSEWMRKMYMAVDTGLASASGDRSTTMSVALREFKEQVFDAKKADMVSIIQTFVNKDRDGEAVDRSLLKSAVELFLVMGITTTKNNFKNKEEVEAMARTPQAAENQTYIDDFETPFIHSSAALYRAQSTDWLATDTVPEYLSRVEAALHAEEARVDAYLNPVTWPKLRAELVDVMLRSRASALVTAPTGVQHMLEEDKRADLGCCYRMFSLWEGGKAPLSHAIRDFALATGEKILDARRARLAGADGRKVAENDPEFVDALIALQSRFTAVVSECCEDDVDFKKDLQTALRVVVNANAGGDRDPHPNAELIAVYLDGVMRGRGAGGKLTEAEIGVLVRDAHELFTNLNDKDLFQESYRNLLAVRLLTDKSVSNDAEREFLGKLKESEGPSFTAKFEGMLTDLTSPDAKLKDFEPTATGGEWDFSVRTLCRGHWPPSFRTETVALPTQLRAVVSEFSDFYRARQGSRRLDFALADGFMTLRGYWKGKSGKSEWVDFNCGTLQGVVLLRFNDADEWTTKALADSVGLGAQDVARLLHPLVFGSACRVILDQTLADAHKAGKKIRKIVEESHTLRFNRRFTSKRKQVQVPPVRLRETANKASVDLGRQHVIDAAIVRIMKTRKTMALGLLVTEVSSQVKRLFAADPRVVKKRIEHLIEQDYLERDGTDHSKLSYVA